MGTLVYSSAQFEVEIEDRQLAHLQIVIGAKLRRNESFYFTWTTDDGPARARNTVWVHPNIPLRYHYSDNSRPDIDRGWLETLSVSANSPVGLTLVPETAPWEEGS